MSFADLAGGPQNIIGGPFGSNLTQADYTSNGIPVIRGSNMGQFGRYLGGRYAFVSHAKSDALSSNQVRPGDVVVTQRGTMGQVSIVPAGQYERYVVSQSQMGIRVEGSDPLFVYYLLSSKSFLDYLDGTTIETGVPHINMGILRSWKVIVPPKAEQARISAILSVLDEKIELNRRIVETVEEMMQALFKSWFVDFDPVRARAEGRPVNLPENVAALFPQCFDEDGLPTGWTTKSMLAQANWINGAAYKDMHFSISFDALPVIKIAELKNGITESTKRTSTDLGERYRIGDGELLFSWSGSPDTSIDTFLWVNGDAWLNQHIFAVRPNGTVSRAYLFSMLKAFKSELIEIARNKQTTGLGHVTRQDLNRLLVSCGGLDVLEAFESAVEPLFDGLHAALREAQKLAQLRDALLPKLISGELRIKSAEAAVEAA